MSATLGCANSTPRPPRIARNRAPMMRRWREDLRDQELAEAVCPILCPLTFKDGSNP
jgi:hypothetical protein